jgi:hypothetical protein
MTVARGGELYGVMSVLNGRGDTHQTCLLLKVNPAVLSRCRDFSV